MIYVPFFFLKKVGWKSLHSNKFTPYYEAIEQVRKQIDIGKMIERFIYLDRVSKSLLNADQRKLLHVFPKENIYQLEEQRKGFKLRERLRSTMIVQDGPKRLNDLKRLDSLIEKKMVDLDDEQYEAREVRDAYNNIKYHQFLPVIFFYGLVVHFYYLKVSLIFLPLNMNHLKV